MLHVDFASMLAPSMGADIESMRGEIESMGGDIEPVVQCPYCDTAICVRCKIRRHRSLSCDEVLHEPNNSVWNVQMS